MTIDVQKSSREQLEELFRAVSEERAKRDREARADALKRTRALVQEHKFTQDEVFGRAKPSGKRYRNPEDPDGEGWSGKGRVPNGIQQWKQENPDRTIEDLLIR